MSVEPAQPDVKPEPANENSGPVPESSTGPACGAPQADPVHSKPVTRPKGLQPRSWKFWPGPGDLPRPPLRSVSRWRATTNWRRAHWLGSWPAASRGVAASAKARPNCPRCGRSVNDCVVSALVSKHWSGLPSERSDWYRHQRLQRHCRYRPGIRVGSAGNGGHVPGLSRRQPCCAARAGGQRRGRLRRARIPGLVTPIRLEWPIWTSNGEGRALFVVLDEENVPWGADVGLPERVSWSDCTDRRKPRSGSA
jgi:hypothetical protein